MSQKIKFILFNLLIVLLVFGSIELGLNYLLNNPQKIPDSWLWTFRTYYQDIDRNIFQYNQELVEYNPSFYYKLKPGQHTFSNREFSVQYKANSEGFRDDEASLDQPEIIVLGDSQGMGWGVEQDQTFAQLLEQKTGKKVLNAAISSYGTVRELLLLKHLDLSKTELIILQYAQNDAGENRVFNQKQFGISPKKRFDDTYALHQSVRKYWPFKHLYNLAGPIFRRITGAVKDEPLRSPGLYPKEMDDFLFCVKHLVPGSYRGKLLILNIDGFKTFSDFPTELKFALDQILPDWQAKRNLIVMDVGPHLKEEHYYRLDDHLNKKGHELIAKEILKEL